MVKMALTDEGSSIIVSVRQLFTLFDASMRYVTMPSSPVIPIRIGGYPEWKDKSIPRTVVGSTERNRTREDKTYYCPFPILKNRARFLFILREIVSD